MAIELGSKLEGKVTGITHFGAFVLLPGNVTGLVHISEIADTYVKDINDHLKVNDMVTVKVINVDKDGKIGLSIRQAKDPVPGQEAPPKRDFGPRGDRPPREGGGDRPPYRGGGGGGGGPRGGGDRGPRGGKRDGFQGGGRMNFEDKLNRFMKESEDRLSALKRNESKRGGRGGRRG